MGGDIDRGGCKELGRGAKPRGLAWGAEGPGIPHCNCPCAPPRFELSPRMREACLIVKTHLGHPGATKSKEVVSWVLRVARLLLG